MCSNIPTRQTYHSADACHGPAVSVMSPSSSSSRVVVGVSTSACALMKIRIKKQSRKYNHVVGIQGVPRGFALCDMSPEIISNSVLFFTRLAQGRGLQIIHIFGEKKLTTTFYFIIVGRFVDSFHFYYLCCF